MSARHIWITGPGTARAATVARFRPDVSVDCHRRLRGPYTGTGSVLRALVPQMHAVRPDLTSRHAIEILAAAPELDPLIGPIPDTLTSLASEQERTRWYSRFRTRRISHGIIDFLRACAAERPLVIAFGSADHADQTDAEFLALALRRLDPACARLVIYSGATPTAPELLDALTVYCAHQPADAVRPGSRPGTLAATAYVTSDCTSDIPGEREAYLLLRPAERARLHDERAAELDAAGEASLRLGALPYHLASGSNPDLARPVLIAAISYCVGMAFYAAAAELTSQLSPLADAHGDLLLRYRTDMQQATCQAMLGRPEEVERSYYELLARSMHARTHAILWYSLAMLYTRLFDSDRKDHGRAHACINTALVIAGRLEDPVDRAFCLAFMGNAKALVELHRGNPGESLRLVDEAIEQFDVELQPEAHQLHRSVLHHNRAQVLAGLGRLDEALAEFSHVVGLDPHYPEYRFDRGNLLGRMGRQAEALEDYEMAMMLGPPFPELYYNRGDLRAATGDIGGALSDFRYVLDLEPDHLDARVSLASLLLDAGDAQGAAATAMAGLAVTPDQARLQCTLGLAQLELAEHEAAWRSFSRAISIDPDLPEALADRAIAAYELRRYDEAIADLTAALRIRPGDPDLLYNRGFAFQAAGRTAEAIADYTLALASPDADRQALLYQRGLCRAAVDRPQEVRTDLSA